MRLFRQANLWSEIYPKRGAFRNTADGRHGDRRRPRQTAELLLVYNRIAASPHCQHENPDGIININWRRVLRFSPKAAAPTLRATPLWETPFLYAGAEPVPGRRGPGGYRRRRGYNSVCGRRSDIPGGFWSAVPGHPLGDAVPEQPLGDAGMASDAGAASRRAGSGKLPAGNNPTITAYSVDVKNGRVE